MSNHSRAEILEASGGNVFRDLGLPDPEERLLKAKLAMKIAGRIEQKGWTQTQVGKHVGLDDGKLWQLLHGRLSEFSAPRLLTILNRLRVAVRI